MEVPKALVREVSGRAWLVSAVEVLLTGGCDMVTIVLGAAADDAEQILADELTDGDRTEVVRASAWNLGWVPPFRDGLSSMVDVAESSAVGAALVHLVDLPDGGAAMVQRVLSAITVGPSALARASYAGIPGHPVLLGQYHWPQVCKAAVGDRGARSYLSTHAPALIECGDLATGVDVDRR